MKSLIDCPKKYACMNIESSILQRFLFIDDMEGSSTRISTKSPSIEDNTQLSSESMQFSLQDIRIEIQENSFDGAICFGLDGSSPSCISTLETTENGM